MSIDTLSDTSSYILSQDEQCAFIQSTFVTPEMTIDKIEETCHGILRQMNEDPLPEDINIVINLRGDDENSQLDPDLGVRVMTDTGHKKIISLVKSPRGFAIFCRVLNIIHGALKRKETLTKRSVYYQDPALFEKQEIVDHTIEDIACYLEIPRGSLGVLACPKGKVAGRLWWMNDKNVMIDCTNGIQMIPGNVDSIKRINGSPAAILVVEKESVFSRLVQSTIVNEIILITGCGMPDYSTRLFLKMLIDIYDNIPILGLFDLDPYGIRIFLTYKYGSKAAAYDNMNMASLNIQWLGLRPSEINKIDPKKLMDLNDRDMNALDSLLKESFEEKIMEELKIMKVNHKKTEIEAIMGGSCTNELIDIYLPTKFANRDWI